MTVAGRGVGWRGENPGGLTLNSPAAAAQRQSAATPANPALSDGPNEMLDRLRFGTQNGRDKAHI
jgi:hypothetical protein